MTILIVRARNTEDHLRLEPYEKLEDFNVRSAASGAHTTTVVVQTINFVTATIRLTTQQPVRAISFKYQERSARTHTYPLKPLCK